MIFGCLGFFINPLYVISIVAIILGIIGHVKSIYYKKRAMIGWILGVASLVFQIIFDLVCSWGVRYLLLNEKNRYYLPGFIVMSCILVAITTGIIGIKHHPNILDINQKK